MDGKIISYLLATYATCRNEGPSCSACGFQQEGPKQRAEHHGGQMTSIQELEAETPEAYVAETDSTKDVETPSPTVKVQVEDLNLTTSGLRQSSVSVMTA